MNFTIPAHQEMLLALVSHNVDFILVGGYAVIYHGYIRTTGDMDVWIRPTNENKEKLVAVFEKLQFDPAGIEKMRQFDFNGIVVFHVGIEPERIDFLTRMQGIKFDDAWRRRQFLEIDSHRFPFLHLDDLIANKLLAGRHQDLADVEHLMKIRRVKK
jgi:hypothetical protein